MYQPNFKLTILVVAFLIGLVAQVSAHGMMLSPPCRLVLSDYPEEVVKAVSDPTTKRPCGAGIYGPTTTYKPGEWMNFAYNVSITHGGNCYVQMNMNGDDEEGFKTVQELGECGKQLGLVQAFVAAPYEHCDKCTLRFMWDDDLGNSYLNCANIKVADSPDCPTKRRRSTRRSLKF